MRVHKSRWERNSSDQEISTNQLTKSYTILINHGGHAHCACFVALREDDAGVVAFQLLVINLRRVQAYLGEAAGAEEGNEEQGK